MRRAVLLGKGPAVTRRLKAGGGPTRANGEHGPHARETRKRGGRQDTPPTVASPWREETPHGRRQP